MTANLTLGQKIQHLRKRAKDSQNDLVDAFNAQVMDKKRDISRSSLSGYENDEYKPSTEFLTFTARRYGVTLDWMLGDESGPVPSNVEEAAQVYGFPEIPGAMPDDIMELLDYFRDHPGDLKAFDAIKAKVSQLQNKVITLLERQDKIAEVLKEKFGMNIKSR